MNESKIAVRYARAFFLLAQEKNLLEKVRVDLVLVDTALNENLVLKEVLFSPVTRPSLRKNLINEIFKSKVEDISINFLLLLIANNRFQYISEVVRVFSSVYRKHKGIKSANLSVAFEITSTLQDKFMQVLKSAYKAEIELSATKNPALIGGFVLTVEDQQYDASIATQIQKLHTSLH